MWGDAFLAFQVRIRAISVFRQTHCIINRIILLR